ncbi:MAG: HAD-IIA family hydrolase [Campylobacterota bacterium]|nr:HAD-IIA family hydrolase [Campylobacterota bacterium]
MYFIDVQGTLIDDVDKQPVRGAVSFIERLNEERIPYMVITNNTKRSSEAFLEYLQSIGLAIAAGHYLDPLMTLASRVEKEGVAAYGSEPFLRVLESMGYQFDYEQPKTVLIAIKEDFTAEEYAQMITFLMSGAKLVGMHETTLYAKHGKRYPGVGAVLQMLKFATSAEYDVVGKPSRAFYDEALQLLRQQDPEASFESVTIISDDVKGDLVGAKAVGMKGVFVLSGKYRSADEIIPLLKPEEQPDLICDDMQAYQESL